MKKFKMLKRICCSAMAAVMCLGSAGALSAQGAVGKTVTVGSGKDYATITEALAAVDYTPTKTTPYTIEISPGTYEEFISVDTPYVNFVGKGDAEDIVITYDKSVGHTDTSNRAGTEKTASVTITADAVGFSAKNVTFQNSYNLYQEEEYSQAVALVSLSDMVTFENCRFLGRQDTLYLKGASKGADVRGSANPARAYLKGCYVEGTVDFIFGDGTAYFYDCDIFMAYRDGGGYFTAANTTLYNAGYVFDNCRFSVDKAYTAEDADKIYLGRPWQCDADHPICGSSVAIINSELPSILNSDGFALWNENTQIEKLRFYEYNNKVGSDPEDTSVRADYVKILTAEQAESFKPFNILRGSNLWNPDNFDAVKGYPAAEVTLGEYEISIPLGESAELITYALPSGSSASVAFSSDNEAVAAVDAKGKISAVGTGSAYITASLSNGMSSSTKVNVTAARTLPPEAVDVSFDYGSTLDVGDRLRATYAFTSKTDEANDNSLLRWSAVDSETGKEYILSEGIGSSFKEYIVTANEAGSYIKFQVFPETTTSYGAVGETASYVSEEPVSGEIKALLKESFSDISNANITSGTFKLVSDYDNSLITGDSETNTASDKLVFSESICSGDFNAVIRQKFNPEVDGLSGDSYEDIFLSLVDSNNYFKVRITRGGNTNSLRWYLIKAVNGVEETLALDESSMKDNVPQNSGEDNPYVKIYVTKSGDTITAKLALEETGKVLSTLTSDWDSSLSGGTAALEVYGKQDGILIDYINVFAVEEKTDDSDKVKLFIAGDSTAKDYGDDNTIGGWGEYLPYYFNDDVEIINKAEGGRSSRSFMNQGRLDEICNEAGEGDYVFIQFGINDGQTEDNYRLEYSVALGEPDAEGVYPSIRPTAVATPQVLIDCYGETDYPYGETYYPYEGGTFKWYIQEYVKRISETGATPVLLTPICRVFFDEDGKITPHHGENDGYIKVILQVAEETGCDVIDFYEVTKDLYESYGVLMVQGLANIKADGSVDLTHYNKFGANIIASKFAEAVKEAAIGLEDYVTPSTADVERTDGLKSADLYVVGDEYAADLSGISADRIQRASFTEYLSEYLSALITVKPMGVSGASAKSYINTTRYTELFNSIEAGDYVVIHFGTNDGISGDGYASPTGDETVAGSFEYYLYEYYVKPIKEKNAVPILITPISAYSFENGEFEYTDGGYCDAVRELVSKYSLYFCNMTENTAAMYKEAGEEGSKIYNAYDENGLVSNALSEIGARAAAKSFLSAMKYSSATFKSYIDLPDEETNYVTKGELAEDLVTALGLKGAGLYNFSDMPMGRSYISACGVLKEYNIAIGDENNCYYPENLLTYEALEEIVTNTVKVLGINAEITLPEEENGFVTDIEEMTVITELFEAYNK
ncbi:MAG: pectinesterase family protein [Eubacterium sp.]|nr:pectinesterase family protein [Eubacterium sp.]